MQKLRSVCVVIMAMCKLIVWWNDIKFLNVSLFGWVMMAEMVVGGKGHDMCDGVGMIKIKMCFVWDEIFLDISIFLYQHFFDDVFSQIRVHSALEKIQSLYVIPSNTWFMVPANCYLGLVQEGSKSKCVNIFVIYWEWSKTTRNYYKNGVSTFSLMK